MENKAAVPTVEEVMPDSVILSSRGQIWQGIEVMQARLDFNELIVPPLTSHTIVINLGQPFSLAAKIDGHNANGEMNPRYAKIVSAELPSRWRWAEGARLDVLHLSLDASFTRQLVSGMDLNPDRVEIVSKVGLRDPQIDQIGISLLAELHSGGLGGKIYTEALTNLLIVHLLRNYSSLGQKQTIKDYNGPLSKAALQLVIDFVNDNLAQDLRLSQMAALLNLSPYYFSRLFKQSTGLSPHQYVIKCRVERAQLLLTTTSLTLQEIAARVGFSDQSHLSRHFRAVFGISPSALRKN